MRASSSADGRWLPAGFLLGAATSSHQVEGDNRDNDWWEWERAGRVREPSGRACDHYRRYEADFDLARDLGHNAHRFSIEWSRFRPAADRWDDAALEHYARVVSALRERGLEPNVTLFHFTLPTWLARAGGWEEEIVEDEFVAYARRVAERLADGVRWWVTINEPMVYIYRAHVEGAWPPGKKDLASGFRVLRRLARAHARAALEIRRVYRERGLDPPRIGVAQATIALSPCHPERFGDRVSVWIRHQAMHHLFVRAAHGGWLFWPGRLAERLPASRTLDYIGVNYYRRDFVHAVGWSGAGLYGEICRPDEHPAPFGHSTLGWEVHPDGLSWALEEFRRYGLPLVVTENGLCTRDDSQRAAYVKEHLLRVAQACARGVPVAGYFHWSLLDNFEWDEGYRAPFGLVEVDFRTMERTVRPSAYELREWGRAVGREP